MIVLAHVSDIHLDCGARASERATRVMAYLNDLPAPVDAILVTGDLADHGLPEEYEEVRKTLSSSMPVFTCPGNKDVRAAYRETLLSLPASDEPINEVHEVAGAVFAMCDSTIPGRHDGLLSDGTLAWLAGVLADAPPDAPVFVCFHHPPVMLHRPSIDKLRQHESHRLAAVIEQHPNVVAVLCGHAHTAAATTFAGHPLRVAPGVASTLKLPWEHGEALDFVLPPAIAFHILDDDRRLTTHYRVIP